MKISRFHIRHIYDIFRYVKNGLRNLFTTKIFIILTHYEDDKVIYQNKGEQITKGNYLVSILVKYLSPKIKNKGVQG